MEEIRVKKGIEVKVNDAGDTIVMNVEDQLFLERFYSLLGKMEGAEAHLKSPEVRKLKDYEKLQCAIEKTREIMGGIDEIFGANACNKIFGNIVPSMYLIADFFSQIEPITRKYMQARRSEIEKKYGRSRKNVRNKGNKRNRQNGVTQGSKNV